MDFFARQLWLIPLLPLLAAGITAVSPPSRRRQAAGLAIGTLTLSFLLAVGALALTLNPPAGMNPVRFTQNLAWFDFGTATVQVGWLLDPLSAAMLVMVTFVGALIFIFSTGYMAHDANFARFFCFLSLFAAAMLGLVVANSLLFLFACWELVGLASYLLIGFWFTKPAAAAAAKKAFLTTRIGDLGFLIGLLWLYARTGTLLFYDGGNGCLEAPALTRLVSGVTITGMAISTAISLLLFCGAAGKSGQVPLHVWLPDAMEGPTPVSALIHAATMVAAGVFLVARVYPLMSLSQDPNTVATALKVVTWIGAITATFAALTAIAQTDIKRILAYSTVSQLGFMMMGIGAGGPAVGMVHLLTHAFFKALLFLGAGSVIHGCHEEQDIRRLGGLRTAMPVTFATYAVGMMALSGVPLVFSGFWSKDAILHALVTWEPAKIPFLLGLGSAALTAFYMTRQMAYVFFGPPRSPEQTLHDSVHESPPVMTVPLTALAAVAVLLSVLVTPFWPWLGRFLEGPGSHLEELDRSVWLILGLSTLASATGLGLGWLVYRGLTETGARLADPLELRFPRTFQLCQHKFYVDELYEATVLRLTRAIAWLAGRLDYDFGRLILECAALFAVIGAWLSRKTDEWLINAGFDHGCSSVRDSGQTLSRWHDGKGQHYLRALAVGIVVLVLGLVWMGRK